MAHTRYVDDVVMLSPRYCEGCLAEAIRQAYSVPFDTASRGEKLKWLDMEIRTDTQHVRVKPRRYEPTPAWAPDRKELRSYILGPNARMKEAKADDDTEGFCTMLRTTDDKPRTMRMDDTGLQAHDKHHSTRKHVSLKHDQNMFAGSRQKPKRMMSLIIMAMLCVHAFLAMKGGWNDARSSWDGRQQYRRTAGDDSPAQGGYTRQERGTSETTEAAAAAVAAAANAANDKNKKKKQKKSKRNKHKKQQERREELVVRRVRHGVEHE